MPLILLERESRNDRKTLFWDLPNDLDDSEERLCESVEFEGVTNPPNPVFAIPPPEILSSFDRALAER